MADEKKDLTEKEAAQQEEKDKDTAVSPTPKSGSPKAVRKSPSGSRPSSTKPGSAKGGSGKGRSGSPTGKKAKGAKGKKKEEPPPETPTVPEAGEEGGLPVGCQPIFLATKTQEIFECKGDEHVTDESPYKLLKKEAILADLFNRAAVCDFTPIKQQIVDYPGDEILIGYDGDFKYGQNFFICLSEEAKDKLLNGGEGVEGGEKVEEEEKVYKYVPPEPKEWISQGSEKEIADEGMANNRKLVTMSVKRMRRDFGAPCQFADRNVGDHKDAYQVCPSYQDKSFDLKQIEHDTGIQAVPEVVDGCAQTDWKYPRNACTQYYPREFDEEERKKLASSEDLGKFVEDVTPRFKIALQQNEIMDVFHDDWQNLGDDDSSFGGKADNHLKEYQSFTDLKFSKDKTITCIDWHPTIRGVVAVSIGERMNFDDRIDKAHRVIMTPSLILVWSFADPINPQLLLEAPDDILSFKFNPTDPNIIAGGCINGQVVLWDISQHADRLKQPRGGKKKNNLNTLPGFEDESAMDTPIVRYCAVSSIEHSHKAGITDVLWVPDHLELNRMGVPHENKGGNNVQLMTCAVDHSVLVWDTRAPKTQQHQKDNKKHDDQNLAGVPTTFKHLDLTWKPMLKIGLSKSEPGGDHSPTKFTIQETQGDKTCLSTGEEKSQEKKSSDTMGGGFQFGAPKPGSGVKRTLQNVKTHFYVGTEDGEIVYVDWMPQKDQDTGKISTPKPDFYHSTHDGPVVSLQRSPFFKDIILCIGGWTFSVWKEGVTSGPILSSCSATKRFTAGHWSISRPAVFYITKQDGSVDIWDLLDRTHEPSMNQSVSPAPITSIYPFQITNKQHLLAVGDHTGTLHILEIPWSLRQPTTNELQGVSNYFEREVKRRGFVVDRWDFREKEKIELEAESKRKAGIAPNVTLTDEEIEHRMKQEYAAFCDEENTFLRELGLKEEVEEALPATD